MPYGQNKRVNFNSIVINALRAKEKTKFKQFLKINDLSFLTSKVSKIDNELTIKGQFFDHFLILPRILPDHLQTIYRQLVDTRLL